MNEWMDYEDLPLTCIVFDLVLNVILSQCRMNIHKDCLVQNSIMLLQDFIEKQFSVGKIRWDFVHTLQTTQQTIMIQNTPSLPHWCHVLRKCKPVDPRRLPRTSIVYIALNLMTKDIYIGETGNFKKRIEDELRKARECRLAWENKNSKKKKYFVKLNTRIAEVGWSRFVYFPLFMDD